MYKSLSPNVKFRVAYKITNRMASLAFEGRPKYKTFIYLAYIYIGTCGRVIKIVDPEARLGFTYYVYNIW